MSSDSENENIHIHLNNGNRKKVFGEDENNVKPSEKYIILMNDNLQSKEKEYIVSIKELENKVEELEDETESLEKKNNYLKGLLKNFHEMDKLNKELVENNIYSNEISLHTIKYFKYHATKHLRYLEILLIGFLGIFYEFYTINITMNLFFILAIVISFQESTLMNLKLPEYKEKEKRNKEIIDEIKKTEASQDYIHEFIESI